LVTTKYNSDMATYSVKTKVMKTTENSNLYMLLHGQEKCKRTLMIMIHKNQHPIFYYNFNLVSTVDW